MNKIEKMLSWEEREAQDANDHVDESQEQVHSEVEKAARSNKNISFHYEPGMEMIRINKRAWIPWAKKGQGLFKKFLERVMLDHGMIPEVNTKVSYTKEGTIILRKKVQKQSNLITPGDERWMNVAN